MKTFIAILLLTMASAIMVIAQVSEKEYSDKLTGLDSLRRVHWDAKNFHAAIGDLNEMHRLYRQLSDSGRTRNRWIDANTLYNLACAWSLSGSADAALEWLAVSVDEGFADYYTMRSDNDLVPLHDRKEFQDLLTTVSDRGNFTKRLQQAGGYTVRTEKGKPAFTYQSSTDSNLVRLRQMYNLDSVAGSGDEMSRIIRLMKWAHHIVRHDGNSSNPPSRNAIDLIAVCRNEKRGVNCRMMATILNEAYLAMGFPSRHITCLPMDTTDMDCHVINVVYAKSLKKWVWMDPTFEGYVTDENGTFLNIPEVRAKLIRGDSIRVCSELNWNGKPYDGGAEGYLRKYMAKNLYWFQCPAVSEFGYESNTHPTCYVSLFPGSYNPRNKPVGAFSENGNYCTNDPDYFWQVPEGI